MTAIAKDGLTPKQREVLDLLSAGQRPPAIAKKLKLTRSSVYNHMRNMRKLGIELPNERVGFDSEPEPAAPNTNGASANGWADPLEALEAATALGRKRLEEIAEAVDTMRERGERLNAERDEITDQLGRFERATKALSA